MNDRAEPVGLDAVADRIAEAVDRSIREHAPSAEVREVGRVLRVGSGIAEVAGLPGAGSEELIRFPHGRVGMAHNLDPDRLGVILLDEAEQLAAGDPAWRTGQVLDVPVGEALLGRVVDPLGRPLDNGGGVDADRRLPIEREAPAILDRAPVDRPLQTGVKVVDTLIPIGRGQRELIVGDRQTGKTAIAVGAILNQARHNVLCVYCSIGQRSSGLSRTLATLRDAGAMEYTAVVAASGEDPPGLRYAAPYAAMSMAEHFMEHGRDVLVVFDDLTRHARAYRELSLLLRRPPGREAYPGDIFYLHARLLERSTHLLDELGGGSVTALPVIETQAQNISAYIPTNLISITDGQVYLSPDLYQQGQLPAVDVGRSVSRVGRKAQLPAFGAQAGDLRLAYSQFQELERFSRYGARLEEKQRRNLEHGRRVREVFKQAEDDLIAAGEQVIVLVAVSEGVFDEVPLDEMDSVQRKLRDEAHASLSEINDRIESGEKLSDDDRDAIVRRARELLEKTEDPGDADA